MSYRVGAHILLGLLIIGIDQFTKQLAVEGNRAIFNSGIALGLFEENNKIMVVISLLVIVGVMFVGRNNRQPLVISALIFAATSNLLDRLRFGAVVDWLPIPGFNITNNLADWIIVMALLWFIVNEYQKTRQSSE